MKPLFLKEVEERRSASAYGRMIEMMTRAKATVPQIFYLFAFKPKASDHLSRFTQEVMRGPSPLSPGLRELMAAVTSKQNHCPY